MPRPSAGAWLALAAVLAVFVGTYGALTVGAWRYYGHGWDLGIFHQATWLVAYGEPPYLTTRYLGVWAHHLNGLLYPLALIYRLHPSGVTLLVVQVLCAAAAAVPIFLLARDLTRSDLAAVAWAALFCAYPPLQWLLQHDFHFEPLALPCFTAALCAAHRRRWWPMAAALLLALLAKEDAGFAVAGLGLGLLLAGERRVGAFTLLGGLGYSVLAIKVVMPACSAPGQQAFYLDLWYHHLGRSLGEVALAPLLRPGVVLSCLVEPANLRLLAGLLAPLAALCLLKPSWSAGAAPILYRNLLSAFPATHYVASQYQGFALPFLFAAAVAGGAWLTDRLERAAVRRPVAVATPLLLAAVGTFLLPLLEQVYLAPKSPALVNQVCAPWEVARQISGLRQHRTWAAETDRLIASLPPDASISAGNHLLAHVSGRRRVWQFPSPFFVAMHTAEDPADLTRENFSAGLDRAEADYILVRTRPQDTQPLYAWGWDLAMAVLAQHPAYELAQDLGEVRLYRRRRP